MKLPTDSFAEPTVWSHEPVVRVELSWAVAPVWGSAVTCPSLAESWLAACSDLDWSWVDWPSAYAAVSFRSFWIQNRGGTKWVWACLSRGATGDCTHGALGETGGGVDVGLEGGRIVVGHCGCVLVCLVYLCQIDCLYSAIDMITFLMWLYRCLYIYRKVMTSWQ